jgi:hypothetical protein
MARINVDYNLVEEVKAKYPEISRLSTTDIVDWAMRKLLAKEA